MKSTFITSFKVTDLTNVRPVEVKLGDKKTHLIITGRNGCGKTTILKAIQEEFIATKRTNGNLKNNRKNKQKAQEAYEQDPAPDKATALSLYKHVPDEKIELNLNTRTGLIPEEDICILFTAHRELQASLPSSITTPEIPVDRNEYSYLASSILQYLVNQKAQQAFAGTEGDHETVKSISAWFESFTLALREVLELKDLELKFDRTKFNFNLVEGGKAYSLTSLSSGQSAILAIFSELLLRVEQANSKKSEIGGIILIDEPETHLHASLQKKIIPFLVKAFPQFQFIITTHSPFIVSSLQNTKILNLETGMTHDDFSSYSYEAILEDYMQVDKYSDQVKTKVDLIKKHLNEGNKPRAQGILDELLGQLNSGEFSHDTSAELALELSSIKLALKNIE